MIKLINLEEPVEYICKEDRESENPTKWYFKPLTYKEECFLKKLTRRTFKEDDGDTYIDNLPLYLDIALCGCSDESLLFVRNEKGKYVFEKIRPWSENTFMRIPFKIRDELASFVIRGYSEVEEDDKMEEEDLKN